MSRDRPATTALLTEEIEAHNRTKEVLRQALNSEASMRETLTIAQARCTELTLELRRYRESTALPGLGWDCRNCGAFNGSMKEELKMCRCCDTPRPS